MVAESASCRILFDPLQFLLLVQRVCGGPPKASLAYDLGLLTKACNSDEPYQLVPMRDPEAVRSEVDRMVRVLVERCQPILDGDEAAWRRVDELAAEQRELRLAQLSEAGLRLKDGAGWRQLPELEAVRARGTCRIANALVVLLLAPIPLACTLVLIVFLGGLVFGPRQSDSVGGALAATALGVPVYGLSFWIVRRVLRGQYYWETSQLGLTIGGLLKRRVMLWSDVGSAALVPGRGYEFQTSKGSVRLDKEALKNVCLEASIWQHLSRVVEADVTALSPSAISLWAQIPEEKAEEIQWENPKPARVPEVLLKLLVWEALIWWTALHSQPDLLGAIIFVAVWPVGWAFCRLVTIRCILVAAEGIQATTSLGRLSIPWRAVRSVRFVWPATLQMRFRVFCLIRIPWMPKHPNSTRVMLAILRRLRQEERFKLLPFPTILLLAAYGGNHDKGGAV